jgi:hypothetical protein
MESLSLPKFFHFSIFEKLFENLRVSVNRSIFEWEGKQKGQKWAKKAKRHFLGSATVRRGQWQRTYQWNADDADLADHRG